jgi:hypothetical protein
MSVQKTRRQSKSAKASVGNTAQILGQAFRPLPMQRQAKTRYWALVSEQALLEELDAHDPYELARTLQCPALPAWLENPQFRVWFGNKHEHLQRIEYLFDLALDAAEQILQNEDPKAQSARVAMIKTLSDLANKRRTEKIADTQINQMTPEQLRAYIEKQAPVLLTSSKTEEEE